ncbi:response regulator [Sphingomonas sp. PWP1-2]|uniref:response regulator n=1 Tax=Sphingomonas sp. PWP1-2 TaxID=2804558 RepID=UPI003CF0FA31
MLNRSAVLIAEDQPFIALDLAMAVEDADGEVVGPAASIKEALALLESRPVVAAILDVNLVDGDISPVVEYLVEHGVPLILQTGVGLPADLAARFPNLVVRIKPTRAAVIVAQLEGMIFHVDPAIGCL